MKYLGLHFDPKLNWKKKEEKVDIAANKGSIPVNRWKITSTNRQECNNLQNNYLTNMVVWN